jgi:hypothetical protein
VGVATVLRLAFLPLIMRCHVAPANRTTPILFKSDAAYVALFATFSFTGGYLGKCRSGGYKETSSILADPRIWRGGGGCGVSANDNSCAHHVTWSPNKLWRSNSIFNHMVPANRTTPILFKSDAANVALFATFSFTGGYLGKCRSGGYKGCRLS